MKVNFLFSASRGEIGATRLYALRASMHYLRQWPYHSKIPRAGADLCTNLLETKNLVSTQDNQQVLLP